MAGSNAGANSKKTRYGWRYGFGSLLDNFFFVEVLQQWICVAVDECMIHV
jgi:hypothetical protein